MEIGKYQKEAMKTAIFPEKYWNIYPVLGLCGEAGEVAEKIKKFIRDDEEIASSEFIVSLEKELGDVLWYLAAVATGFNIDLNMVAINNLKKLEDRMRRGKIGGSGDDR